jgi:hypothetical protein
LHKITCTFGKTAWRDWTTGITYAKVLPEDKNMTTKQLSVTHTLGYIKITHTIGEALKQSIMTENCAGQQVYPGVLNLNYVDHYKLSDTCASW